jgi:NAD-dependent deacetylase
MTEPARIVILTGAGISAESGIRTFRDAGGLWEEHRLEDVASPKAFKRDPEFVQRFYNARREQLLDPKIQPNLAHLALARLEQEWKGDFLLVTQNVDDLHERAGSRSLIHMHGELLKARCQACEKVIPWREAILPASRCPHCEQTGRLRPHVVWFGELTLQPETISRALERADIFISIGTSGQVYPASFFVEEAPRRARKISLNLEPGDNSASFKEHIDGPCTETVPRLVAELLAPKA